MVWLNQEGVVLVLDEGATGLCILFEHYSREVLLLDTCKC